MSIAKVHKLPLPGPLRTEVWASDIALERVAKFRQRGDPSGAFWKKLAKCAQAGFELFERGDDPIVKHEAGGVYRFGIRSSLFRLIGFYDGSKDCFIVIDAFLKTGQKLSGPQRQVIEDVVEVKAKGTWKRAQNEPGYPRLA